MTVSGIKELTSKLGKDIAELFDFEVEGNYIVARPKQYLTNFDQCASAFRNLVGGEYKGGLGRNSHFRVPIGETPDLEKSHGGVIRCPHCHKEIIIGVGRQLEKGE